MAGPTFKIRIYRAIMGEHSRLNLALGLTALLLAAGFWFSSPILTNTNYTLILQLADFDTWGTWFYIYGMLKLWAATYRSPPISKFIVSILGLWLWTYISLSFVVFDPNPLVPTETMLFITVIMELWNLTVTLHKLKYFAKMRG